jgi:hypothetical protein
VLVVMREQRGKVDVEKLIPVQSVDIAFLATLPRREADATAAPEPLRLLGDRDLDA